MSGVSDQVSDARSPLQLFKNIPNGYQCTGKGVRQIPESGEPIPITLRPVLIKALSRTETRKNWGALIWWVDLDGWEHEEAIPKALFHAKGVEVVQRLVGDGLPVVPGKEASLLRYLAAFEVKDRLISASCTGWLGDSFVLPYGTINEPEGERMVYQPAGGLSSTSRAIKKSGSLQSWKAGLVTASPVIKFLVCVALSAPFRFKANIEAGGFHIYNLTSQGKTTALQAASSVWGNGVDPAIAGGDEAYIQRWNATANALEAKAEAFNDLPLVIDEVGEGDPKEFGRTIYRVIAGTGRGRSDRSGGLRDSKSWRVTILSAGELAISEFIESGGGRVKGGQMVRMVDIDLSSLPPLFDCAEDANDIKQLLATHYGHAGPKMLEADVDPVSGWKDFDGSIIGKADTSIEARVLTRFALVAHIGVVACKAGVLSWSESQIIESVSAVYSSWLDRATMVSDVARGVEAVRAFILAHESRFQVNQYVPQNRAGWIREGRYHFTSSGFKEACGGVDAKKVRRELCDRGLLYGTRNKGLGATIKDEGKTVSTTAVLSQIFCKLPKNPSAPSALSAKPGRSKAKHGATCESDVAPTSAFSAPGEPDTADNGKAEAPENLSVEGSTQQGQPKTGSRQQKPDSSRFLL